MLSKPELPVREAFWQKEWNGEVKFGNHSNVSCLFLKNNRNQGGEGGHGGRWQPLIPGSINPEEALPKPDHTQTLLL